MNRSNEDINVNPRGVGGGNFSRWLLQWNPDIPIWQGDSKTAKAGAARKLKPGNRNPEFGIRKPELLKLNMTTEIIHFSSVQ